MMPHCMHIIIIVMLVVLLHNILLVNNTTNDHSRLSLQTASGSSNKQLPVYENREQIQMVHGRHSSDLTVPYGSPRRASFDDGVFSPSRNEGGRQVTPLQNVEEDKFYQNIQPVHQSRASPTKKSHLSPISVPVPEGYYAVTPPPLVKQHHLSTTSPSSSSPEENIFDAHISDVTNGHNVYGNLTNQEVSMAIVGDNLVVKKTSASRQHSKALSPTSEMPETGGVYQNVEFMKGSSSDQVPKRFVN